MDPDYTSYRGTSPTNPVGQVGAQYETFDQFVDRMIDEGASPEAAKQAAAAHFEFEATRSPRGEFLPGWTARRWQETMFVGLGGFLAVLISVLFTAPAFHPTEPESQAKLWGTLFLITFFPFLALMVGSGMAMLAKEVKEMRNGYTTLRWVSPNQIEIRDSHGKPITSGDKRLTSSAKYMHAFLLIGSACAVLSPVIWIVRLVIQ
jgi:hypothetical protein